MAEATTNTTTIIARADQHDIDLHKASDRVNFGSIREPIDVPYLLGVQTDSFDWLIGNERWQKRVQEDLENGTNTVPHTPPVLTRSSRRSPRSRTSLRP